MKIACHSRPWEERFSAGREAIREAGYRAVETFCLSQWLARPAAFRDTLGAEGLELAAMECGGDWIDPDRAAAEIQGAELLAEFLAEIGAGVMVASGGRRPPEGAPPERYEALGEVMTRLGVHCRDRGVKLCFHPKPGTLVEYRDQIGRFMGATDPDTLSLCFDTGDLAMAGCDPLEVARSLGPRIGHVHLKDLDWRAHRPLPPGAGSLDLREVLGELHDKGYAGWITVELDRSDNPLGDARSARDFVEAAWGR